jgi:hypothetical protein
MMFRAVFWVILQCKMIVDHHFTRQYNPEDSSEHFCNCLNCQQLISFVSCSEHLLILWTPSSFTTSYIDGM